MKLSKMTKFKNLIRKLICKHSYEQLKGMKKEVYIRFNPPKYEFGKPFKKPYICNRCGKIKYLKEGD